MLHKQLKTCFFIAYLGLLLNLGPSLHHADIFGLHSHDKTTTASCSCSCLSHSAHTDSESESMIGSDQDCAFCKFFDQYNVIVDSAEPQVAVVFSPLREFIRPAQLCGVIPVPHARGPPVVA